ncbi:quinone oxidoreductase [uncultured Roseibium sp.]|uniref:quinone oxidoreductase family protein n=1 Tax=uncultured Roseibium sp. TaxID=1936171 RepID=UPI00261DFC29|nr:quinone oxidoreductase [uncultured Roseibium sp.]
MQAQRIMMTGQGAPEVMQLEQFDVPPPGKGELQIEQTAIGLNYMDIYQRSGHYPLAIPSPLGLEAAGKVTAVGPDVEGFAIGDRVVYGGVLGAYATVRNAPAARVLKIPDGISDETAAAVLMKGMTAEYLLERCFKVQPGMDVLFFAASGGVGQLAGQWGKQLGARMIGVTSGAQSCAMIKSLGYAEAIDRTSEDIAERVKELTGGKGVPVVFDSIGKATFDISISSLATYGMFVSFGATTGEAPPVPPSLLQKAGSLYFTRPTLANYVGPREDLEHSANRVFEMILAGNLSVNVNQKWALADVAEAHRALESGSTTGSSILLP